tara:strand:- start:6808 stop:7272 length:465 start_codon:yes stop_codon:yes gene_type:complete
MEECYICAKECDSVSPCNCKTLYIHDKCLLELISKTNKSKCEVCKEEFKGVDIKIIVEKKLSKIGRLFVTLTFLNLLSGGVFVYEIIIFIETKRIIFLLLGLLFGSTCIICLPFTMYEIIYKRTNLLIDRKEKKVATLRDKHIELNENIVIEII